MEITRGERTEEMTQYIFVTGGVVSGLGKGLTSAAIGTLLESHGLKIALQKFDPYINVDPGTMSPFQHGEVYVTLMGQRPISILGITSDSHPVKSVSTPITPLEKFTLQSFSVSAEVTTSAKLFR